ncbi:VCBS domain-containing protein [Vibrio wakamikoensis]|uniref:VCBS domain-containing protein n=1 Tax=Vibrio wakamikoensis TaxID=2910251 RepID=UPI003D1A75D3
MTPVGSVLGTLTITETGAWNYEVDNTNPTVQGLGEGDSLTETFQVLSEDGTPQNIVITINGVNDVPTITSGDSVIAQEDVLVDGDGNIVATNTLVISDDDTGEEVFNAGAATPVGTTLGSLTIDAAGVWTYKVDNSLPQIQALDVGTSLTESFTVTSADGTEHQIDVTVNGTEDPTIISNYQPGAVTEDTAGILTDSGSLTITDLDSGEALFNTTVTKLNNGDGHSPLGNLTIDANGNWTYTVDNSLTGVQELGDGITRDEVFQVTSIDGSVSQTIVVTITGVDGAPSIVSGESGDVTEDAVVAPSDTLVATDKLVITDEDAGENVFDAGTATPVGTTLGSLTITADGTWTYTLDNTLTAVQALDDGDKVIEEFTITSADGTEHTIAVTINGTEDETFITGPTTDTVKEDNDVDAGLLTAGDNLSLTITDNDAGENKFSTTVTSVVNDNGQLPLGTLTITEDGDWSYQVSNALQEIQSLGDGDTRVERFTVTSIDGSKTETIEVTIQGTNDLPVIDGDAVGLVIEDINVQPGDLLKDNGQLTISDVDTGEAKFQTTVTPVTVGGITPIGTLTITATGAWSYEVDNTATEVQQLGAGDTRTETFQVLSEDGTPHNVVVTINGTNDAPQIGGLSYVELTEDQATQIDANGDLNFTSQATISDVDLGEGAFVPATLTAAAGNFTDGALTIDSAGNWTYKIPNGSANVQGLAAGERATQTFTVETDNNTTHTITVDIVGVNDGSVLISDPSESIGSVTEDDTQVTLSDNGVLELSDVDGANEEVFNTNPNTFTSTSTVEGAAADQALGTLTITTNGAWNYQIPNANVEYLGQGETATETFTVLSEDGTPHTITVTIIGTNDAPVIAGTSDPDGTVVESGHEDTGGVVLGTPSIEGQIVASDIDLPDNDVLDYSVANATNPYGTASVDQNGVWKFELNNGSDATQALEENETATVTFDVVVTDDQNATATQQVTITIQGTNDKPYLTSGGVFADSVKESGLNEAGDQRADGQINADDYDLADNAQLSYAFDSNDSTATSVENQYGTFTINSDGSWSFELDNTKPATQALRAGESTTVDIDAFIIDDRDAYISQTLTVTINGTNDQPTISGTNTGDVVEDRNVTRENSVRYITSEGSLRVDDVDTGESIFNTTVEPVGSPLGTLTIDALGDWDYQVNTRESAIQRLGVDETMEESFRVYSVDGTSFETITITITGTNDRPNIRGRSSDSITENVEGDDSEVKATGDLNPRDADATDVHTWSVVGSSDGQYGSFSINASTGTWEYILDNDKADSLQKDELVTETFTVLVDDGNGGTRTKDVTINITGTNDALVLTGDDSATVVEDLNITEDGVIDVSDLDTLDTFEFEVLNPVGVLGDLTIDQNGKWTYTLVPNRAEHLEDNVTYPADSQFGEQIFQVSVTDGTATKVFEVSIDVIGTNDAPDIDGVRTGVLYEVNGYGQTVGADLGANDPDLNETEAWQINDTNAGVGTYGTLTLNPTTGEWEYTLGVSDGQKASVDALAHDSVVTETFSVSVTDKYNAVSTKTITITVNGDNDRPVIGGTLAGEVTEDVHPDDNPANPITTSGTLTDGDVDIGDDHTWSINSTKGQYGNISIDPQSGEWVYTLNNNNPTVQGLKGVDSETLTDTFTVTVKDDSGQSDNTATQTITVTIKGTNDTPDVKGDTSGSVIEATNARSSATGALTVSDIDTTDSHTWTVENEDQATGQASGTYGYMSVDDNGRWTYQLQSDWDATREIPPGESRVDSFEVIVTDEGGLTDTITVNVTIAGTNTDPEISVQPSYTVIEDGANLSGTVIAGVPTQGQLDSNVIGGGDPDLNEVVTWSVLDGGQYGTFSIDEASGTWQYVLNNNALAVDSLDKGDTLEDTVRIRVLDKFGHESIQDITINIVGENDVPNIRGAQTRTISEDTIEAGNYTATGQLNPGDVDADDFHLWEISDSNGGRGEYGSLILSSDGQWTFTYDQADKLDDIKALKPGERVTDTFEVTVTDSHDATSTELVTIRIEGQNDAPTVSGDITGTYVEDNGTDDPSDDLTPLTGRAILSDVDNDDFAEFVIADGQTENVYSGLYGDLSIDKDGNWQFTPKNDVIQSLNEDEVKQEVFTVIAQDQNGATITQDITISIEGRNDVPVITGESTGTVVEDGTADIYGVDLTRTDGQLVASDVDNESSISGWSIETSGVGTYGTLTVDNNGKWTYVIDNSLPATQALISGETVQETFYVVATDNDGGISNRQEVVIDVVGQRDPGDGSGGGGIIPVDISELEVTEDGQLIDGDSYIFDVPEAARFVPVNGGIYGQLVRTPDGNWQYELDNDSLLVQGLDEGETATENWRIILGPFYINVDVTINGTADKPEITYSSDTTSPQDDTILLGEAFEDVTDSISGVLGVDDADLGDTHVWVVENGQGSYGTLTVDSETGEWTYVLDPSVELPAGEEVFDTFFVTVTDTDPNEDLSTASDRREVKVKIVGSAEDVVVEDKIVVETVTANEDNDDPNELGTGDSAITITSADAGGPLALDPDLGLGDQITWTLIDGSGTYGNITVNQDGSWVFTLDNDSQAVQSLQEGQTRQDVFEVYAVDQYGKTIVDENGLPQTLEIVVNVNGQNDAPTLQANVEETIVADDPDQTISGQLSVSDVDTQDQNLHTWAATPTSVENDYGTLQFNSDGSWTYVVNPNNADIIALGANESIPQTWQVTVTDPSGLTDTQTLTINIRGENQAPTMVTQDGEVTEDDTNGSGSISVTKAIVLDDVDTNDTVTLAAADLNGTYGQFVVDPTTNTWTYELYNDEPHVQALADGVKVVESFTVRATDSFGAEVTQTVEVTITGTNDRPSVSGAATGSVSDNLGSTASGKVTVADVDIGDGHTFDVKQDTDLGTFTIDNTGKWTFVVDEENAEINALAKGQTKTVQVSVIATDDSNVSATEESNEHFITITIVGTNDAPQIVDIGQQMATENTNTQLSGTFDDGDVDTVNIADDHLWEVVSGDPRGDLSADSTTGAWTFDLTGDFEYLSEGETLPAPLTYEVKVTDEHGASDTITVEFQVTGTNDAPTVVAGDTVATGTVFEDPTGTESGTASGEVKISDVDQSDTHSYSLSGTSMMTEIVGTYGTLKLIDGDTDDTVKWEYVIDQDKVDSLNDGPVSESFDLYIESLVGGAAQGDAITQSIDITVQGRNDAAIVSPDSETLDETNAALTLSGNLDATDVDNPDDTFTAQTDVQGTYGKFSVQADGQWTFVADEAYDSLNVGQSVSETFQVTTIDGTPTSVTVKIEGTNDAAQVSVGSVVTDETDAALTISDTLTASDVDNPDNTFTPSSEVGTYGSFSIDANGVWTFVANDSFDNLNVGEHVKETFNVTSVDGTPSTVTVQINGTNDASTISAASQELTETDSALTAGGTLTSVDPDNPDNSFIGQSSTVGTLGTFTLSASGVWTFEANSAFDNLADGVRVEEVFDVFSIDGTQSQVTIGITGSNDAATVDSADVSLQESDIVLTTGGTLTATDVDNPDNTFIPQNNVAGTNGTFSIDANGVWSYTANQAFDGLNSGESVSDTFIVKSADGTESSVKVTINGTNDAATISAVDRVIAETDAALSTGGTLTSSDPDNLDNKFLAQASIAGAHGVFSIDEDGVWSYDANEAFDSLNVGDSVVDSFNVQSIDGTVSTVKVTIQGTNDAPVIGGTVSAGVQEGVTDSATGTVTALDVDSTVTRSLRGGTLVGDVYTATGTYGTLTFNIATGIWAYVLIAGNSNALAAGDTDTDNFIIDVSDGLTSLEQPITITVTGNQGLRGDSALDDILVATSDDEWMFGNTIPAGGGISSDNDSQDTFRWETANLAGTDTIKDFDVRDVTTSDPNIKHDVVDLTAVAFKDDQLLTDQLSVSEQSGNTVFEISDNGVVLQSIVLEGIALHTLLGVTPSEVSDFTPTEVLVALYQSEQLTLPDQIKIGTDSATTETIVGTDDSDILFGGGGNDILTGGDGHDLFLFTEDAAGTTADPAEQTVTDFSVGSDILDISDLLPVHDNIGDLLGNISISVTDDPADAMDNATTVISVTNNGEQTDITLEGVGWNELGISDASVINDPGNHQTELLNQLDTMNVIKIDP